MGSVSLLFEQFVRTVKFLKVRKEGFTVSKLHVIIDTHNISWFRLQNSRFRTFSEGAKRRKRDPRV